jgi:hypothetical protein
MFQPWKDHARGCGMADRLIRLALTELAASVFAS